MNIKGNVEKIPGGMMVVPLIMAALINTFFPKALEIGGFTTALFKNGATALIGMFLVCMGVGFRLKAVPKALMKGSALLISKHAMIIKTKWTKKFVKHIVILVSVTLSNTFLYGHAKTEDDWTNNYFPSYIERMNEFGERPNWSHDGKKVLCISRSFGEVFEMEIATGIIRPLSHHYYQALVMAFILDVKI